jgi:hypothetical protein
MCCDRKFRKGCCCGSSCECEGECCCSGGCSCSCCCGNGGFERRYQTRAEKISELDEYLKELKKEVQAVEEQLADLKRKK